MHEHHASNAAVSINTQFPWFDPGPSHQMHQVHQMHQAEAISQPWTIQQQASKLSTFRAISVSAQCCRQSSYLLSSERACHRSSAWHCASMAAKVV